LRGSGLFLYLSFGGNGLIRRSLDRLSKFLAEGICADIVNRAGRAFHLKTAALEESKQLLIFHSYVFGKLVDTDAHICEYWWVNAVLIAKRFLYCGV
jgi:hypothetical protein